MSEIEAILIRAAQEICVGVRTGAEAVGVLKAKRRDLRFEAVGPTARMHNLPDAAKERLRRQRGRKRGTELKVAPTRIPTTEMTRYGSDRAELDTRLSSIRRIAQRVVQREIGSDGLPRTLVDDKLDATLIERNATTDDSLSTEELARVYDLPPNLIEIWLEAHPDPLEGIFDRGDATTAQSRRAEVWREGAAMPDGRRIGVWLPDDGTRVDHRSGLPKGRPRHEQLSPAVIERATGYSFEVCLKLMGPGRLRKHVEGRPPTRGRMEGEKAHLCWMLSNMVKRKEATISSLAATFNCSRDAIERMIVAGDLEPVPVVGAPPGWRPERQPYTVRWVEPEPSRSGAGRAFDDITVFNAGDEPLRPVPVEFEPPFEPGSERRERKLDAIVDQQLETASRTAQRDPRTRRVARGHRGRGSEHALPQERGQRHSRELGRRVSRDLAR